MFDFFRKPIFLIILAAALITAGVWAYFSNKSSQQSTATTTSQQTTSSTTVTTPTISNLTNIDPKNLTDTINAQLSLADTQAAAVDKKLQLSAIEVDLPGTLDQGSGSTYYIYSTTSDTVNNWVIAISNSDNKYVRSKTVKADYMGNVTTINRSFLKTSYVVAIQIAEKNGGKDYRQGNTLTAAKLTLKNSGANNWLYWTVEYDTASSQKQFQIDASTSAIVTQ
ncbi:MAG: hypothetical protein NTY30_03540 [Candidatus Berkelbacteria bacterium]|nr:hypothetical protein [Candidatus Berkelbacteria bacterium]